MADYKFAWDQVLCPKSQFLSSVVQMDCDEGDYHLEYGQ